MEDFYDMIERLMSERTCRVEGCEQPALTNVPKRFRVCKDGHFDFGTEQAPTVGRRNG